MKKIVVLAVAAVIAMSGTAMAAGTSTVAVSANVLASCTISAGTAAFGNLDPANPVPINAGVSDPQVTCTNGTAYSITDDGGLTGSLKMANGANLIQYSLGYTNSGTGNGSAGGIGISASVAGADYQFKPAGAYTDTVTLTVNP